MKEAHRETKTNAEEGTTNASKHRIRECCSCLEIPLELLGTRIYSTEIKARQNKESQSDKQPY